MADLANSTGLAVWCDDDPGARFNCGYIRAQNRVAYTQTLFASLSIVASLAVPAVIYAHHRDRRDLRHRILINLFLSCVLVSAGNVYPANGLVEKDGAVTWKGSIENDCWVDGMFLGGNYWMVCVELFIIWASVLALRTNSSSGGIGSRAEALAHFLCPVVGTIIMVVYVPNCVSIWTAGDDAKPIAAQDANSQNFNRLWGDIIDGWLGLFGVCVAAWLYQRYYLHRLLQEWDLGVIDAEKQWDRDLWDDSNPETAAMRATRRTLLDTRKEGFLEVANPLAAYLVVFIAWSVPAAWSVTDQCEQQTSLHLTVGCQHICQMLLSLRPLATAAVFFADPARRAELYDVKGLARRLFRRALASALWAAGKREIAGRGDRIRYRAELEHVKLFEQESTVAERPSPHRRRRSSSSSSSDADGFEDNDGSGSVGAGMSYELMADA